MLEGESEGGATKLARGVVRRRGFFTWFESRTYKMHIRVLLSRYRRLHPAPPAMAPASSPDGLLCQIAGRHPFTTWGSCRSRKQESSSIRSISMTSDRVAGQGDPEPARLPVDVGLGYLTLDRQSRTLSGGEAQRVTLTTALGSALANTLFVLDEPSMGLHPREMPDAWHRSAHQAGDAGNTLVVVEHDPQIMLVADRILDMGPGPGERGGEIVFLAHPTN